MAGIDDDLLGPAVAAPAVGAVQDNPDHAAQAINLSNTTGAPASTIYDDLDGFKSSLKQQAAGDLVRSNPQLGQFTIDPMNARVSNDDLATLDGLSHPLHAAAAPSLWDRLTEYGKAQNSLDPFKEGFDLQGQRDEFQKFYNSIQSPVGRTLAALFIPPAQTVAGLYSGVMNQAFSEVATDINQVRLLTDPKHYDPTDVPDISAGLQTVANIAMAGEAAPMIPRAPEELAQLARDAQRSKAVSKPFLDEGKPPPVGVDPHIDALHLEQNQQDLAALKESLKQAGDSTTRARAPTAFQQYVRQHVGDQPVGISLDAVRDLYGTDIPAPNDGKLGFVSDLPAQMLRAGVTGQDIRVPLSDMITYAGPTVVDGLSPAIRMREGGVTQIEAQAFAQKNDYITAYHGTNRDYSEFNPNADSRMASRSGLEQGVSFFADTPEGASTYGDRILKAQIDPGKTATFDVRDMYNNDPAFMDKIIQAVRLDNADRNPDLAEQFAREHREQYLTSRRYQLNTVKSALDGMTPEERAETPFTFEQMTEPHKMGGASGARQAAMLMAREQGLDTVRIKNLAEGDQLAVLNPGNIKYLTDGDVAVKVLRQSAGLADRAEPYPFKVEPATPQVQWLRPAENGTQEMLVKREAGQDHFANVGEAEGLAGVVDQLSKIAGPLSPMEEVSAKALNAVLDHVGASDVPLFTVPHGHPTVGGNLGMYYPESDAVVLRHTGNDSQMLKTAVHEGYHAAFAHVIETNSEIRAGLDQLIGFARDAEGGGSKFAHDGGGLTDYYGLTNAHEFASEVGSSDRLREFLSKQKLTDEQVQSLGLSNLPRSGLASMWDGFLILARKAFGLPLNDESLSMLDAAFKMQDRLTAAARENAERQIPVEGNFSLSGLAQPDTAFDHAAALGMSPKQLARYRELIAKQAEADRDARNAEILAEEQKRQSTTWKANEKTVRSQVAQEIPNRPDIRADSLIRAEKLDTDVLTPEQRTAFDGSHTRGGLNPDALANTLGFDTGDEMLKAVADLREQRGDMQPGEFQRKLVADETSRRMEAKYGNLRENVVQSALDRVLSETQMELVHNDLEAASGKTIDLNAVKADVADKVSQMKMSEISSQASLAAAGRAAGRIEDSLLKGDAQGALQARIDHENALLAAKEMSRIEKLKTAFDKTAKRYSSRIVEGAAQDYVDQMHDILLRLGQPLKRSVQDLQETLGKSATPDLISFVDDKERMGMRELHVPDFMLDPKFQTKLGDLTASQFEEAHDAIKSMAFNARDELKVTRAGEKVDLQATLDEMRSALETLGPAKTYPWTPNRFSLANTAKAFWWSSINLEKMFNRIDRGDWKGVFSQSLTRTWTEAANYKERMLKDYAARLNDIMKDLKVSELDKKIDNPLFVDPITGDKQPLTRRNVLGMLQNAGNPDNLRKLAGGYGVDPREAMDFITKNTTKADWDRAQKIGDLFDELHNHADNMSREISGVGINKLNIVPIEHEYGNYRGWYNPVAYDTIRRGESRSLLGPDVLEQQGYFRATTPQAYTKTRNAYVAPVQFDLNIVPTRMHQMIHDITMRPAIIQLSKFFYKPGFLNDITKYYGDAQSKQLLPFLRDVANSPNFSSDAATVGNAFMSRMASNTVSSLIGMNVGTVLKHSPTAAIKSIVEAGPVGFAKEFVQLLNGDEATGKSNWGMAMQKSDELARRMTNFKELVSSTNQEISLRGVNRTRLDSARSIAQWLGTFPVAATDIVSAVPLWLSKYKEAIANGEDEGMAVSLADRSVRDTHGSSIYTNKPQIARSKSPIVQSLASLYGFFSENLQKQYEIAWRAKDALGYTKQEDYAEAMGQVGKIAPLVFTSVLIPAMIEEAVTPLTNEKHQSWGSYAAHVLGLGLTSSLLGFRDVAHAIASGQDSSGGLIGDAYKGVSDMGKDLKNLVEGKSFTTASAARAIRHVFTLTGLATGLTNASEGKAAQYAWRYFHGLEHPKDAFGAAVGARFGTGKGHSASLNQFIGGRP